MLEKYIFARGFWFFECVHCPRHTICSKERAPKQLQCACILDGPHKNYKQSKNNQKIQFFQKENAKNISQKDVNI